MKDLLLELWKMHGAISVDPPAQCKNHIGGVVRMDACMIDVCPARKICKACTQTASQLTTAYESVRPCSATNKWLPALAGPFTANWWATLAAQFDVQLPRCGNEKLIAHMDRCYGNETCQIFEENAALTLHDEAHHA